MSGVVNVSAPNGIVHFSRMEGNNMARIDTKYSDGRFARDSNRYESFSRTESYGYRW